MPQVQGQLGLHIEYQTCQLYRRRLHDLKDSNKKTNEANYKQYEKRESAHEHVSEGHRGREEFWKLNKYHLAMFVMCPSLHGITFTALYIIH